MVACLRDTPMFQLMNTHPNFYKWKHLQQTQEPVTAWSPRVDPEAGMSFMPNEPIDLMTSGNFQHVPWITGITDDEGATRSYAFFEDMEGVREWEEKFAELGPLVFGLHDGQSEAPKVSNFKFWFSVLQVATLVWWATGDPLRSNPLLTGAKSPTFFPEIAPCHATLKQSTVPCQDLHKTCS